MKNGELLTANISLQNISIISVAVMDTLFM